MSETLVGHVPKVQHAGITPERWAQFSREQQILMIANEMVRSKNRLLKGDRTSRNLGYERVFELVDLTVSVSKGTSFLRELLRWRWVIAELYLEPEANLTKHMAALRVLRLFTPQSSEQWKYVGTLPDGSPE